VIGCGSYQPIKTYAEQSASKYPIYTDPTLRLHEILKFKYNLSTGGKGDEQRDYMRIAGSVMARTWASVRMALGHLDHVNYVGPKSLNGGEVIISAGKLSPPNPQFPCASSAEQSTDGECEYIYRMQNTVDHTNVSKLASLLGAQISETKTTSQPQPACGETSAPSPVKA
jgi:hypothetical protein